MPTSRSSDGDLSSLGDLTVEKLRPHRQSTDANRSIRLGNRGSLGKTSTPKSAHSAASRPQPDSGQGNPASSQRISAMAPTPLDRLGSSSLQERLASLSTLLAEERRQRAKKRVQMPAAAPTKESLGEVAQQRYTREMQTKDEEIRSLRHVVEQQRRELEALQQTVLQQQQQQLSASNGLGMEVEALLRELQSLKEEMMRREFTEQRAMEEAAQLVMSLELEMQNLASEYEESQVEVVHLRRMLQKHDAALQSETQQLSQRHTEEVAALARSVEESERAAREAEQDLSEATLRIQQLEEDLNFLKAQAGERQQLSAQEERGLRAALEDAENRAARLENALHGRPAEEERSRLNQDEAFLRMAQAMEQKSEENTRLLLTIREQRRQMDLLQQKVATSLSEAAPSQSLQLRHVTDLQARLLQQKEEEIQALAKVNVAKDQRLILLEAEVRRLSGRTLATGTERSTVPLLSEEHKWDFSGPKLSQPRLGQRPAMKISIADDDLDSLPGSAAPSTKSRLYELRCELEEARLKRERLTRSLEP